MSETAATEDRRRRLPAAPVVAINARTFFTLLTLLATVSLLGTTLAQLSATTVNPGGTFTAGALILSNQVNNRTPCLSTGPTVACDALFSQALTPGKTLATVVTIKNEGTVPAELLTVWSTGACATGAANPSFSGTGDLCEATWLTIHDDAHDMCYYPSSYAGPCLAGPSGTIADFAKRNGPDNPINLSIDKLATGIPYSFVIELDPSVGNQYQGRSANFTITWKVSQG